MKIRMWNGTSWIETDAVNAANLGGLPASSYSLATHNHTPTQIGAVANSGGVPSIQAGVTSSRPAAGTAGRIYVDTTTRKLYRDTGTSWDLVGGDDVIDWTKVLNKPTTFAPSPHQHDAGDLITGTVDPNRLPSATTATKGAVVLSTATNSTSTTVAATASAVKTAYDAAVAAQTTANAKADIGHNHDNVYYTEAEVNTLLAGKAAASHTHDDRYYTETEMNSLLAGKAAAVHDHDSRYYTEAEVNTLLAAKLDATAKAADANLLDGIDSPSFARRDAYNNITARTDFTGGGRLVLPVGANYYAT